MTREEALMMAIEALDNADYHRADEAIVIIKEALAQPEQEPVAWRAKNFYQNQEGWFYVDHLTDLIQPKFEPLYTTPPQRTWVGLTDEECKHCTDGCPACDARKLQKEAHDLL
jgi:hypothetical protein